MINTSSWIDRFGSGGSLLCAAHCGFAAFAPGFLAAISPALRDHWVEWVLVGFAVVMGAIALVLGFRQHRSKAIAGAFAVFIIGLISTRIMEESGIEGPVVPIAIISGLGLMVTHIFNFRACRACQDC